MKSFKLIILFTVIFLPALVYSQASKDTVKTKNLGESEVFILKSYQPVLNDAFKINLTPSIDTSTAKTPILKYDVDPRPMNSNFNLTPIKPVKIKDETIKKLYHGFLKVGYGLENMPMVDFYYNTIRSKQFVAGVSFKHLSSTGKIKDYGYPGNSNNELGIHGTKFFPTFSLSANVNYDRDVVHYYGYNSPPDLYTKGETKHGMNDINGRFALSSLSQKKDDWKYNGAIEFYSFKDNRASSESNVGVFADAGKNIDLGFLSGNISYEAMKINQPLQKYNHGIFRLLPNLKIKKELYLIDLGANLVIESNDGETFYHFYPKINANYQIIDDQLSVFAGINGDVIRNDLRSFSKENPFLGDYVKLKNTNNKIKISGGTKIKLAHDLMFLAEASYGRYTNQPFYFNKDSSSFPVTYTTIYDDVNLFTLKSSIEYKMGEKILFGANIIFNNYKTNGLEHPLYVPLYKLGINGAYTIADKITAKIDLFYNGESYGIEYNSAIPTYTKLKSYFDANLSIDYRYSKLLSVFVQLNNLGFSQEFRYYRYPSYRFTGLAGVTLSF